MGNNYNFTEAAAKAEARWKEKRFKQRSVRKYEAFSRRFLITNVCKVKLRQFVRETARKSVSDQERKVNALASGADEGRD